MRPVLAGGIVIILCASVLRGQQIRVLPTAPLRKKVAAMPRVSGGNPVAVQRINRALAREDDGMRSTLRECDSDIHEMDSALHERVTGFWERTVTVTMAGPAYLSLHVHDFNYCGGAYPDDSDEAMVFDLRTGDVVNWDHVLGKDVSTADLKQLYVRKLKDTDCRTAVGEMDGLRLLFWLDARAGSVMAQDEDLPHVIHACGESVPLSADEARSIGVPAEMLTALQTAHNSWKQMPKAHEGAK